MSHHENKVIVTVLFTAVILLIFLWLIKFFNISYPISVTNQTISGELSVVGTGQVEVIPDNATVSVGIVADAATAQAAEDAISTTNNKVVAAIEKLGISKNDIKTTNYSVNPTYNYSTGGQNTIAGYSGNATLSIKVKDTNKLPDVITAATNAGANQIYDTQYVIQKPEKYQEEARNKAIANAKEQAQKLASQLGIRLGKIINISESSQDSYNPMPMAKQTLNMAGGGVAPDLQPGNQTVTSTVTLYFQKN